MVAFSRSAFCGDAEPYYYDYLSNPNSPAVPAQITAHIQQCLYCQQQVHRLERTLAEAELARLSRPAETAENIIDVLGLHFEYIGEHVTCAEAKPFVPLLLIPSVQIKIPTPITVHVDCCEQCDEDSQAIGKLDLRDGQLVRLGRLYTECPIEDPAMCERARRAIPVFAAGVLEGIETDVLHHLCLCPHCQALVYRYRRGLLTRMEAGTVLCNGILAADLFDHVMPYGRVLTTPTDGAEMDKAAARHLRTCPQCLGKMQTLHQTLYGVAERADSGIATIYTTQADLEGAGGHSESPYMGYPIDVKVLRREPAPVLGRFPSARGLHAAVRSRVSSPQFRPIVKTAVLAAAMIPLAILFLLNTQVASGISVRQIAQAVDSVANLHVLRYDRDSNEPIHELWIARDAGLVALKNGRAQVLYNLRARDKAIIDGDRRVVQTPELTWDEYAGVEQLVSTHIGLVQSGIPADAELLLAAPDVIQETEGDTQVYEVVRVQSAYGEGQRHVKLRISVDATTRLPRKTEVFRKALDEQQWQLQTTRIFEYPSRQTVEDAIADMLAVR